VHGLLAHELTAGTFPLVLAHLQRSG